MPLRFHGVRVVIAACAVLLVSAPRAASAEGDAYQANQQTLAITKLYEDSRGAEERKDWARAKEEEARLLATPLLPDALANVTWYVAWTYYGLACADARLGDPQAALHDLGRAVAYGVDDPEHIASDADLEPVRTLPGFAAVIAEARGHAAAHSESGTLFVAINRSNVLLQPEDIDRLALLVPATDAQRERVLVLRCTPEQRRQLLAHMHDQRRVTVTGTGGTASTVFVFTVTSFAAASDQR